MFVPDGMVIHPVTVQISHIELKPLTCGHERKKSVRFILWVAGPFAPNSIATIQ